MRYTLLYIILFLATASAAQPYKDITSDWCKMGLKGKVKEMHATMSMFRDAMNSSVTENESVTKFSEDGYIKEVSFTIDGELFVELHYQYLSDTEKHKGLIVTRKKGNHYFRDSLMYVMTSDTSYTTMSYNNNTDTKQTQPTQYIYNKHQQLIVNTNGDTKSEFVYNKEGQRVKVNMTTGPNNMVVTNTFSIISLDAKGNTTLIADTFHNSQPPMVSTQKFSYTYYE